MSEGINLLDSNNNKQSLAATKRMQTMRFVAMSMLFVVSVASVILFILVSLSPLPDLKRQESSLRATLAQSGGDMAKLAILNDRATSIDALVKDRRSYEDLLAMMQAKLPANAQISVIRVEQKTLVVTVESLSLASLDQFTNGMIDYVQQNKLFSQVKLTSLAIDNGRNSYSLTLSMVML